MSEGVFRDGHSLVGVGANYSFKGVLCEFTKRPLLLVEVDVVPLCFEVVFG